MQSRLIARLVSAAALTALAGGLAGCGTHHVNGTDAGSTPAPTTSSSPTGGPSTPASGSTRVVTLLIDPATTNRPVRLRVGQELRLRFDPAITNAGAASSRICRVGAPGPGGNVLTQLCTGTHDVLYSAHRPGTVTLAYPIRPHCSAGTVCPDWMRLLRIPVTVSS